MRVSNNLAVYYLESGDLAKAAHLHKEAADQSQALGDRSTQANALTNLGYGYTRLGEYPQARAALDQALGLCRAIDARREGDYVLLNLGLAHWREGDSLAARRAFEQATSDLQAINDAFGVAAGFSYLGLACEQAGDWAEAQERYHQAMQQFKGMGIGGYATDALAGLARCALARGEPEQARQQAEQVWRYVQEQGSQGMEFPIWGFLTCAQVFEALGESEKMQAAVELGCQELQQRAGKISDPEWRQSFLENVPEHRRIWGYQGGASAAP